MSGDFDPRFPTGGGSELAGEIGSFGRLPEGTDREIKAGAARQLLHSTLALTRDAIGAADPPLLPILDGLMRALESVSRR